MQNLTKAIKKDNKTKEKELRELEKDMRELKEKKPWMWWV